MAKINQGILGSVKVKAYTRADGTPVKEHERSINYRMQRNIEKFLDRFPNDAKSWADATDEVRELSRSSRTFLEEAHNVILEPVNFASFQSPSEWNKQGKASILNNWIKMNDRTKQEFYNHHITWFGKL